MRQKIELLAPGGDVDSIKAAIAAGADAVFCGLDKFNARNRAENISFNNLQGILKLAHKNKCKVFLTLNILIVESEFNELFSLLNKLINTGVDGVIVQDFGLFYLLINYFGGLKIHASTQLTTHNLGQIKFLKKLNSTRINLSRELNINEIKTLTDVANKANISTEVFVHGSYCISFSGICYLSSLHGGKSGNRGRCSQPCRDRYLTTEAGKNFPLNLKDNSAFFELKELIDAGVTSLKIEGRIKEFEYVYTVVKTWKKQIDGFYNNNTLLNDNSDLYTVFNRDFSNSFLKGDINKDMFIDNPMSNSINHFLVVNNYTSKEKQLKDKIELYEEKAATRTRIICEINELSIEKTPLKLTVSGKSGAPLKIVVQSSVKSFVVHSTVNLADVGTEVLNEKMILKRLKAINETEFYISQLDLDSINDKVYLPFKELTSIKKKLLFILNDSKHTVVSAAFPILKNENSEEITPMLSVLISSKNDLHLYNHSKATIYFQLPGSFKSKFDDFVELFLKYKKLIPWFPSVLIGDDYETAVDFIEKVQPKCIVTDNTGIAFEAYERGISWIAGPYLNCVNSFSLLCLKEKFNCSGAFISNEISKTQIQNIKKPAGFNLYYSIYHPIVLMTSRQCLFHQVTGCTKNVLDKTCIQNCVKTATITNLRNTNLIIEKTKGNYHRIYNETNYLNTDIVTDFPNMFSGFFIDLRDVKSETQTAMNKSEIITLFESFVNGNSEAGVKLKQTIQPTTNVQYLKGI